MKRDEILAALKDSRAQMEAALAGLTEAQMEESSLAGGWSVKDVLSHLTAWEAEMVTALSKARQGLTPKLAGSTEEVDALNAQWRAEHQGRLLEQVLADFHGVRKQTLRQLEALSDKDLAEPRRWLKNKPLSDLVAGDTFEHEAEHATQVLEWRKGKTGQ